MVGLFLLDLTVAPQELGAYVVNLHLTVNVVSKHLSGVAIISQPGIWGSPTETIPVWGSYGTVTVGGKQVNTLHLVGNPAGPDSTLAPTFYLVAVLDGWTSGTASFRHDSASYVDCKVFQSNAPVEQAAVKYQPIHALYAVALQDARVSGDTARLSATISAAEEQLKAFEAVEAALPALKAEIARLEAK